MSYTYKRNSFHSVYNFYKSCFDSRLDVTFYVTNEEKIINMLLAEDLTTRQIGINLLYDKNNIRKLV